MSDALPSSENDRLSPNRQSPQDDYDVNKALQGVEGDWGLLRTLINIFLDSSPKLMVQIREAFDAGDLDGLGKHAHQLKGSFGTLQAIDAAVASARVEKLASSSDTEALQKAFRDLDHQYMQLIPVLQAIVTQDRASSVESTIS